MENQLMVKLGMFEQQVRQIHEQIQAVEQGIVELDLLNYDLQEINGSEGREIFSPVGRGIFLKSKVISEELLVDVGQGNLVKKSVEETREILQEQIKRLNSIRKDLDENLERVGEEIEKVLGETGEN
jgi:prefoldin alpha subunit